jgi:signal transduction histidine kinase
MNLLNDKIDEKMTRFIHACNKASGLQNIDQTIQTIACELTGIMHFDFFSISLLNNNADPRYYDIATKAARSHIAKTWRWEAIQGTELGRLTAPGEKTEKEAPASLGPQRPPYNLPAHTSVLLMSGDRYIGNWALGRLKQEPFDKTDLNFIKMAAPLIALMVVTSRNAVKNMQLEREMEAFEKFLHALNKSDTYDTILKLLCETAKEALQATQANYILKESGKNLAELFPIMPLIVQQHLSEEQILQLFQTMDDARTAVVVDTPQHFKEQFWHKELSSKDLSFFQPFIIAPIVQEEALVAYVFIVWKGDYVIDEHDLKAVAALTSMAQSALSNALCYQNSVQKAEDLESFVYTASHELKSPIQTVKSYVSLIHDEYNHLLPDECKKYIERIQVNLDGMEKLIMDLLELSRIGRIEGQKEEFESREAIQSAVTSLSGLLKKYPTDILLQKNLPGIYGMKTAICQVFTNLLSNAIKFSHENENPSVEIGCNGGKDYNEFYVQDNGSGISPELHKRIFELFHTKNSVESDQGTGVGLAVVKKIVELHNGRVWVESQPGQGATFKFTIPVEK